MENTLWIVSDCLFKSVGVKSWCKIIQITKVNIHVVYIAALQRMCSTDALISPSSGDEGKSNVILAPVPDFSLYHSKWRTIQSNSFFRQLRSFLRIYGNKFLEGNSLNNSNNNENKAVYMTASVAYGWAGAVTQRDIRNNQPTNRLKKQQSHL